MRDDFSEKTKRNLALRVGHRCCNPACGRQTSGPRSGQMLGVSIGVAAHIHAASPGGARYEALMTDQERRDIRNGIWLCQVCAKLIDNDESRYTASLLHHWKHAFEDAAGRDLARVQGGEDPAMACEARSIQPEARHVRLALNTDHTLKTLQPDFELKVARLAVHSLRGEVLGIDIVYPELETLLAHLSDPIVKAKYQKRFEMRAQLVSKALVLLFSPAVQNAWSFALGTAQEQVRAAQGIIEQARTQVVQGHKLDVWRTLTPRLSAPIYLDEDEAATLLDWCELGALSHMAFGPGRHSADELPTFVIVEKLIPSILIQLACHEGDLLSEVPDLLLLRTWHVGGG